MRDGMPKPQSWDIFIVEKNGQLCKCGRRGCLETKVSYVALCKIAPFAEDAFGETFCKNLGNPVGRQFVDALDLFARSIVNSATTWLQIVSF